MALRRPPIGRNLRNFGFLAAMAVDRCSQDQPRLLKIVAEAACA